MLFVPRSNSLNVSIMDQPRAPEHRERTILGHGQHRYVKGVMFRCDGHIVCAVGCCRLPAEVGNASDVSGMGTSAARGCGRPMSVPPHLRNPPCQNKQIYLQSSHVLAFYHLRRSARF